MVYLYRALAGLEFALGESANEWMASECESLGCAVPCCRV